MLFSFALNEVAFIPENPKDKKKLQFYLKSHFYSFNVFGSR
jgi:hypothetical protein